MVGFPLPTKLLQRIVDLPGDPVAIALCPDFERGAWRGKKLVEHLFDWLPDVALRPRERQQFLYEPRKTLAMSCRRVFDTDDPSKRGEIGEILLHAACRQEFETASFVARLFYKMRSNDSVTSVDVVHVRFNQPEQKLELWLGEAKMYDDCRAARYRAYESVKPLWDADFLHEMKALIGPKIEDEAPYSQDLARLFADEVSLDQIVSRIVIPICIAADFKPTADGRERTSDYIQQVEAELQAARSYLLTKIPTDIRFVVIFVPLGSKAALEQAVNQHIESYR